jgi:hypothetical protein
MSFLDNLENNLKSLESREEGNEDALRREQSHARERAERLASASYTDELKKGPFTAELLRQATRIGYELRTKIHMAWLGSNLRLEARERRLELRPTASGIMAVYFENGRELRTESLDLKGSPETLLRSWLAGMKPPAPVPLPDDE